MKKWNRALALLLAAGLAVGLCSCGKRVDNSSTADVPADAPVEAAPEPASAPEPDLTPEPASAPEPEPIPVPEPDPHGLVIQERRVISYYHDEYTLYCLNPETGETSVISTFDLSDTMNTDGPDSDKYVYWIGSKVPKAAIYSEDFSRLAVTKQYGSGDRHVGWMDGNGSFFDVTEALGQQRKSDFDPAVNYWARGFSNGCFEFFEYGASESYYVPVDNVVPEAVEEGTLFSAGGLFKNTSDGSLRMTFESGYYYYTYWASDITSWIDDTHCIMNDTYSNSSGHWRNSYIFDTVNHTRTSYVPGDSTSNWNGVISPDGTEIAFMAQRGPTSSEMPDAPDIYIMPVDGGDPVKVTGYPFDSGNTCTLVDWI